jgi:NTE family protein
MSEGAQDGGPVALVLAGGGARGAYEVGALSVLLPELESHGQRPTILVGNSVGALNAAFLAAGADRPVGELLTEGMNIWKTLEVSDIIGPMVSIAGTRRALGYLGQLIGFPGARLWSLLDSHPLEQTIDDMVDFTRLNQNVTPDGPLEAVALVAMSALTRRSVVFHKGGGTPPLDPYRLIEYVATDVMSEHVRASAAIPTALPAVHVQTPHDAEGWYMDGGLRLNTPIKPAIKLGAQRIVVVALSSLSPGPSQIAGPDRPDAFAGISQLVQGMLADTLVQDVHSLATVNEDVKAGRSGRCKYPYIVIAPGCNDTIDRIAFRVLRKHYRGLRGLRRSRRIWALAKLIGAGVDVQNPSPLSLLLFDPEFVESLMQLGAADARRWIGRTHDEGLWQVKRM